MPLRSLWRQFLALLALWLGVVGGTTAAELVAEVIPLRYRMLEQVLPVIQPLVPPPGTASGVSGNLVLRTTPANLVEIKRVLATIDRLPRRLLITVRQDADRSTAAESASGSASISTDSRRLGSTPGRGAVQGSASAQVYSTQSNANDRHTQQVHVLEGAEASISVGASVPVVTRSAAYDGRGNRVIDRSVEIVEYRDILSGFTVRPQLAGDRVMLQITPQHDTPARYGRGSTNVQRVSTSVSGQLGEWIEIGAVVRGSAYESGSSSYRTSVASGDNRQILIKVEELDNAGERSGSPLGPGTQVR